MSETTVIGFDILDNPTAQKQLLCLAEKTGGVYLEANGSNGLSAALEDIWNTLENQSVGGEAEDLDASADLDSATAQVSRTESSQLPQARIAFTSMRDGNDEVYVVDLKGLIETNLSSHPSSDGGPNWSPDGRQIAFSSRREGNFDVYVMNSDGSGVTRLTMGPADEWRPIWSPNGEKIAFISYPEWGNEHIFVINSDGSGMSRITEEATHFTDFRWSPDGSRIVYSHMKGVAVVDSDGSNLISLDIFPGASLSWSPSGDQIAVGSEGDIFVMTPNGTGIRNLTNSTQLESKPAWSPDGSVIAYVANVSQTDVHQKGIFVMTSDGSEPFQLATSTAIDGFDWSPDGGWIVYPKRTEAADGFAKGFVVSLDGSKTLEITQGIGDDYSFAWSD